MIEIAARMEMIADIRRQSIREPRNAVIQQTCTRTDAAEITPGFMEPPGHVQHRLAESPQMPRIELERLISPAACRQALVFQIG